MDFSQWYSGWSEREKYNTRQRRDFAKAFETFKKDNPYATFKDYQDYIDQMAGGSNYIRGGAPSQDVLRNMASENARNLAAKRAKEAHDAKLREFDRLKLYQEMAQPFLMGGKPDEIDKRKEEFYGSIGEVSPLVKGALDNYFSNNNYMTQQGQLLLGKVDQAANYLTRVGGKVENKEQFAQLMGVQPHFVDPLIDMANSEYEKRRNDHWLDKTGVLEDRVVKLAARGGDIDAFIKDTEENGIYKMTENLKTNLRSIFDSEETRLDNEVSQQAAEAFRNIRTGMDTDQDFMVGLLNDGYDEILAKVKNRFVNQMSPDQFMKHFGSPPEQVGDTKFKAIADELIRIAQNTQAAQRTKSQDEVRARVTGDVTDSINERFDQGVKELSKTNIYNNEESPAKTVQVFQQIAQNFYPSPAVQSRLLEIVTELEDRSGDNWSAQQLYAKAMQDSAMGRLLKRQGEYSQERVDKAIELQGGYDISTFKEWIDGFSDLQDKRLQAYSEYDTMIERNAMANIPLPPAGSDRGEVLDAEMKQLAYKVQEFEKFQVELEEKLREANTDWNSRRERSQGPTSWLKTGTKDSRWKDNEANDVRATYQRGYGELLEFIRAKKEEMKNEYLQLEEEATELLEYNPNERPNAIVRLLSDLFN
tara:strand:- start:16241 stop:18178 length:1938 start_codon:yes stop_codon:yes gene_type:complete